MDDRQRRALAGAAGLSLGLLMIAGPAAADSGPYVGVGAGGATLEAEFDTGAPPIPNLPTGIDEDDTALKVFAGYTFDLAVLDLSVEGGYVDFGEPEISTQLGDVDINTTAFHVWGIAAIDVAVFDVYAKLGYAFWDVEAELLGQSASTDGSDLGYGVGAAFGLGPVEVRGEYEVYDFDDFDIAMLSLGLLYRF